MATNKIVVKQVPKRQDIIMEPERIITHTDFDGLVSAAICSHITGCERIIFTGPNSIARAEISIDLRDIVCDLPYPLECGIWFDHHAGNREELKLRGIDINDIPGAFSEEPSCARVIYNYYTERGQELPSYFENTVAEADVIDSFDYNSIEEWREERPGRMVDMSLKASFPDARIRTKYYSLLTSLIRDMPLEKVVLEEEVKHYIGVYRREEGKIIELIEKCHFFYEEDVNREIIVVDVTDLRRKPRIIRNLAYLVHPSALASLLLVPIFRAGVKTNDFSVSMSLSMNMTSEDHGKDISEIMRSLNIGDGHPGAAAGIVRCGSKVEREKKKAEILDTIWQLWSEMN